MKLLNLLLAATLASCAVAHSSTYAEGRNDRALQAVYLDPSLSRREIRGFNDAARYSARHGGVSFLIRRDGRIIYEAYTNGGAPSSAWELASGTKSFSGVLAAALVEDGILSLDERVSDTIDEWKGDPVKEGVTVRQLLTLTSGISGGELGRPLPYKDAIAAPFTAPVGTRFQYGPTPFQVFGALVSRKLAPTGQGVRSYLETRVLNPAGVSVQRWRVESNGDLRMPFGAHLTARDWALFGELIANDGMIQGVRVLDPSHFQKDLFTGTTANPAYGLSFWLNEVVPPRLLRKLPLLGGGNYYANDPAIPTDLVAALGKGGQSLWVSKGHKMVIVRQARIRSSGVSTSYRGDTLLSIIFKAATRP